MSQITHSVKVTRYYFENRVVEVRSETRDGMNISVIKTVMGPKAETLEEIYELMNGIIGRRNLPRWVR